MSGQRLGFVSKVYMCECSVFSEDLMDLSNTSITAQETGHFFNNKTSTAVHFYRRRARLTHCSIMAAAPKTIPTASPTTASGMR
jgi:hypothetical protein